MKFETNYLVDQQLIDNIMYYEDIMVKINALDN